jgi:uncharacterized RDD family membrane protein YckC
MTEEDLTLIPREARRYQGHRAGLVSRFVANTLDALVVTVVVLAGYVGLNGFLFLLDPRGFEFTDLSVLLSLTVMFFVLVLYLTACWATTGRTYGAHVMGLRVVSRRGRRLGPLVALGRAAFCAIFPIGLMWCAVSLNNRSVQDVVLRTSVIYDWRPRAAR